MRHTPESLRHGRRALGLLAGAVAILLTSPASGAEQSLQSVNLVWPAEIADIRPSRGPATGGTIVTLRGYKLPPSPTVLVGGTAASVQGSPNCVMMGALNNCNRFNFVAPAKTAGTIHDVVVGGLTLPQGYFANFTDVPEASPFAPFVETMVRWGVTAGVGGGNYGVSANVTRAQMAVFVLRAKFGISYVAPPATGTVFADVPAGDPFAPWIEQMYALGMTGGCASGPLRFCPNNSVTREQMAVFLIRAEHGPGYIPPAATGLFSDMPLNGPFTPWAEQMKREGISAGTSPTTYGPAAPVSRGAMAIFLKNAFSKDYYRLAQQATWGVNETTLARIRELGVQGWLNEQFSPAVAPSGWPNLPVAPNDTPTGCGAAGLCQLTHYTMYPLQKWFFVKGMIGYDQLRQRVTWALHQLWVVGGRDPVNLPSWMDTYMRILENNAFGSYRNLMEEVTLNPAMGRWLDTTSNSRTLPNENFAREILQLFNVGTEKRYIDGTYELDGNGMLIPTYEQAEVDGFTRVFTGWRFNSANLYPQPGSPACSNNCGSTNYKDPLVLNAGQHDSNGGEQLLDGFIMPTGLTGAQELDIALDNILAHPNVGTFVAKHMIQQLVTANPSPGYQWRVAEVFNNDGTFTKGNMRAVVEAVLMDPEARGAVKTDPNYGHMKEPALYMLNILRAFNAHSYTNPAAGSDGVFTSYTTNFTPTPNALEQDILRPLTVFNYYPLDYLTPGTTDHWGPEFGIYNATAAMRRANWANAMVLGCINTTSTNPSCTIKGIPNNTTDRPAGTKLNVSPWVALATSSGLNTGHLVDELNRYLLHGTMSPQMRQSVITAVNAVTPNTNHQKRAETAIYMIVTSPHFMIVR